MGKNEKKDESVKRETFNEWQKKKKPNDGMKRKDPDEGVRRKNPDEGIKRKNPDEGIRRKNPDEAPKRKKTAMDYQKPSEDRLREEGYYLNHPATESFICRHCGKLVKPEDAGTDHRNHCPYCLYSVHLDNEPGDRAADCGGQMEPVSVWVRRDGEWALIHRCSRCGALSSNRIAADDNPALLMSIAVRPLARPPFPLDRLEEMTRMLTEEDVHE